MIGRTNTGGGGGGGLSPNSAVIHVTAPVGSTISFAKGGVVAKVLGPEKSHVNSADASLADWYFSVSANNYGTWTVTATLGTDTASDSVTVSSNKQYDVELTYNTWLFRNGAAESLTGGVELVASASITSGYIHTTQNSSTGNYWEFVNALDVLSYGPYLHYRIRTTSIYSGFDAYIGTFSSKLTAGSYATNQSKRAAVNTLSVSADFVEGYVDLSNLTLGTNYYVGFVGIATTDLESMYISKEANISRATVADMARALNVLGVTE